MGRRAVLAFVFEFTVVASIACASIAFAATGAASVALKHTITATTGPYGSITPSGTLYVADGDSVTYTIAPDPGNFLGTLWVDNVVPLQWPCTTYTFTNVKANHAIRTVFGSVPRVWYTITPDAGPNGSISPATPQRVMLNGIPVFVMKPDDGYVLSTLTINNSSLTPPSVGSDGTYVYGFGSIHGLPVVRDYTIAVTFALEPGPHYTVTPTYGPNCGISPLVAHSVAQGHAITFAMWADPGYRIAKVLVDGRSVGAPAKYTFTNVSKAHTIAVSAAPVSPGTIPITSPITRLKTSSHLKEMLATDGNLITYEDEPEGPQGGFNVGVYDMSTGTESIIATGARWPAVSGNTIVCAKSDGVYAYDWPTRAESLVAEGGSQPKIDGRTVVYDGGEGGSICGVDLSTGATFTVSTDPNAFNPDIGDGWVVYTVLRACTGPEAGAECWQGDIMGYEIATGRTQALCTEGHDQENPRISSTGRVVWEDERNSANPFEHTGTDIYGCTVQNPTNVPIVKASGVQSEVSVDGNLVTYCDSRRPSGYLAMGLDLLSGVQFGIVPRAYAGTEMLSWSGLADGTMAWNYVKWHDDGSENGTYTTNIYVARPAQIDVTDASDPYANAASCSRSAFPDGSETVIVASGESWADDAAVASLAGTDTPVLLTARSSLPTATADELRRLGATSATILGGTDVISEAVYSQIQGIIAQNMTAQQTTSLRAFVLARLTTSPSALVLASTVERIRGDRYAVAAEIARRVAARPMWNGTVVVATGSGFTDAISASSLCGARGIPLVLSSSKGLSNHTLAILRSIKPRRAVVIGNGKRVPSKVSAQLRAIVGSRNVRRLSGKDSYANAAAVADYAVRTLGLSWSGLGIMSTASFQSALTGGLAKSRLGAVLLLTGSAGLSGSAGSALRAHRVAIRKATCLGSSKAITRKVRGQVRSILH
jgi:putative cell wall-binding protein